MALHGAGHGLEGRCAGQAGAGSWGGQPPAHQCCCKGSMPAAQLGSGALSGMPAMDGKGWHLPEEPWGRHSGAGRGAQLRRAAKAQPGSSTCSTGASCCSACTCSHLHHARHMPGHAWAAPGRAWRPCGHSRAAAPRLRHAASTQPHHHPAHATQLEGPHAAVHAPAVTCTMPGTCQAMPGLLLEALWAVTRTEPGNAKQAQTDPPQPARPGAGVCTQQHSHSTAAPLVGSNTCRGLGACLWGPAPACCAVAQARRAAHAGPCSLLLHCQPGLTRLGLNPCPQAALHHVLVIQLCYV